MSHALEVIDEALGAGALLAATGGSGLGVVGNGLDFWCGLDWGRHSKTHINWLKLWVFACLEFEEKMNLRANMRREGVVPVC